MVVRSLLLFSAIGCPACVPPHASPPAPQPAVAARDDEKPDEKAAPQKNAPKMLTAKPVTVDVAISDEQNQKIAKVFKQVKPRSVGISLRGVQVPGAWDPKSSVLVFVNHPTANAETGPEESGFVAAFFLGADSDEPKNFGFDLAPALNRLKADKKWAPGQPIQVTFVVSPPEDAKLPADTKVPFETVELWFPNER